MDHHCHWTGNCVGSDNIQFFFQFLMYCGILIPLLMLIELFALLSWNLGLRQVIFTYLLVQSLVGIVVGSLIAYLLIYQLQNALVNLTTVEDNIGGIRKVKPFNTNRRANLEEVFGKGYTISSFLLPIKRQAKNNYVREL